MTKVKKIASLVVAATMITSSLGFAFSVNAAESTTETETAATDTALQNDVGDGVILHAFNWSYNSIKENLPAIAAAGYSTVQTSPVQQPKDYGQWSDVANQWWKLYQPVSMSIAEESWLGTKADLTELCEEAEKYGIKIICDIVSNHMGNETEDDPNSISSQIETYAPDIYNNSSEYFRSNGLVTNDNSIQKTVQGHLSSCPDLITNSTTVQNAVISLLKECIDCGVDGFRFDAAKHIETPDDGEYASDYWPNVTSAANEYYNEKTGDDLYVYGEVLNTCGSGRSYSSYTKYINVTDNTTGNSVRSSVVNGKASSAASATYKTGCDASDVVLWAESHDTYMDNESSEVSDSDITKTWAIVASRKDSTALFFARPGGSLMGEAALDTTYKSTAVSEINKFHNLFVGQSENLGSSDDIAYVARGTSGIVLVNCAGSEKTVSISDTGIADGIYTDTITGNTFTVKNGVLSGSIGSTGVAVVYNGSTTPRNTVSVESGSFTGDTMTVTLGLDNASSGTYSLDGMTAVTYTGTVTIRIGSDYNVGETVNLTVTATDGSKTTSATYSYEKKASASSGVYLWLNPANRSSWSTPYYVYIYDEDSSSEYTYSNAAWPGQQMQYDEATGYYYVEVSSTSCIATDEDGTTTESSFDLAHSENSYVIFGDGNTQYPGQSSKTKLSLGGSSKILAETKSNSYTDTTLIPSKSETDATNVVRGTRFYGDVDNNGTISIIDVTLIQKYLASLTTLSDTDLIIADVNEDGINSILDATAIQKYLANLDGGGITGQVYSPAQIETEPTQTTSAEPDSTEPTATEATQATEPTTTEPSDEYTVYLKTYIDWLTADGVELFAYNSDTGESYQFVKDESAYPNVYTISVPNDVTSLTVYRALSAVSTLSTPSDSGPVYNSWQAGELSSNENCIFLSNEQTVSVIKYVEETKPEFVLDRVYFDNSKANWSEVYIYGWSGSGINNTAIKMTQITGTDIWYYDFDEPLSPGASCFLFKDTKSGWTNQTNDITVVEDMNCYCANKGSKSGGTWSYYTE